MTTIAYKDGVIAYDSRVTADYLITDDDFNKAIVCDVGRFFFCGQPSDFPDFIKGFGEGKKTKDKINASGFYIGIDEPKNLYLVGYNEDGYWKQLIDKNKPYAVGSGQDHAFTAMDMGGSAVVAVKMAAKRDAGTGGRIRSFKISRLGQRWPS